MNLIDIAATPLHRVVSEVERLAAEHGAAVVGGGARRTDAGLGRLGGGRGPAPARLAPDRVLEVAGRRVRRAAGSLAQVTAIQLTGHDLTVDDVEGVALHGCR